MLHARQRFARIKIWFCTPCAGLLVVLATHTAVAQTGSAVDIALEEAYEAVSGADGISLAITLPSGRTWAGAKGIATVDGEEPLRPESLMRVGSLTKSFVAAAILLLEEDGLLSTEDTVEEWLPGLIRGGETITVHNLLNHSSGLHDITNESAFWSAVEEDIDRVWLPEDVIDFVASNDLVFAPGTRYSYSNSNYTVLGMIVERAAGETLAAFIKRRLLEPLQLFNTHLDNHETPVTGVAHGLLSADVASSSVRSEVSAAWAAGAMVSTASDLSRWVVALYGGDILSEESRAKMLGFGPDEFGYAVFQADSPMGRRYEHDGGIQNFNSWFGYWPEQRMAMAAISNRPGSNARGAGGRMLRKVMALGEIFPADDVEITNDILSTRWSVQSSDGAEDALLSLDDQAFDGTSTTHLRVVSQDANWRVRYSPDAPVLPLGYTSLRMAVRLGDLQGPSRSVITVTVNSDRARGNLLRGTLDGLRLDLSVRDWQVVEIPIESMLLTGPITDINLYGNMTGEIWIDDLRLVAAPHADGPTAVTERHEVTVPTVYELGQNYPNPFNSATTIRYSVPHDQQIDLSVYDLAGQQIATLVSGLRTTGRYHVRWDAVDDSGRRLASGVYIYRLRLASGTEKSRKLLLLR